ncbi:MAG: hypothetical protein E6G66_04580 [Actinobacteria bacterium]|nr:MAG: hypothetical protein E6G66_04580 [Actinomycetota bacterium]
MSPRRDEKEADDRETWDAIRARRNVRVYTEQPIAAPDLDRILEAGHRSPSSQNRSSWISSPRLASRSVRSSSRTAPIPRPHRPVTRWSPASLRSRRWGLTCRRTGGT